MAHDYKAALDGIEWKMNDGTFTRAEKSAIRAALQLAQEAEQLRKENERLVRENEVYSERHKAWESCVYAVGLPMMKAVRDTEYGDAVPPIPVVNKITDLLDECFKLRKERDELMAHSHKIERLQKAYVKLYEAAHSWQDPSKLDHALDNDELAEEYNKAKKVSDQNG